jgi:hypothetical protein
MKNIDEMTDRNKVNLIYILNGNCDWLRCYDCPMEDYICFGKDDKDKLLVRTKNACDWLKNNPKEKIKTKKIKEPVVNQKLWLEFCKVQENKQLYQNVTIQDYVIYLENKNINNNLGANE